MNEILISGAGVAGPALAWWLARFGFNPTVVERAPRIRAGGQAVDFRGPAHFSVLERMGILPELRRLQTHAGAMTFIDARGRPIVGLSSDFAGGDLEVLRGDLGNTLYEASRSGANYLFDDTITEITQTDQAVAVRFERAPPRAFDLVIGADGLHSNVRRLVFGDEARFVRPMGYHVAIFSLETDLELGEAVQIYCTPGRAVGLQAARGGKEARAVLYFASPPADIARGSIDAQKRAVAEIFAGMAWETPRVIEAMWRAPDFYLDSISQVRMDAWSSGRVALIGDAGYGGTLGGMGTGLAIVAAYVLAGELATRAGDHAAAFARYAAVLGDYAHTCRKGAASVGRFMAPKTRAGLAARNLMLWMANHMSGQGLMERIAMSRADGIVLPDYI